MKHISIAIDGPAGAGKSTISKAVASNMGFVYIDTGAMYRTVALFAIENGIDIKKDKDILISRLDEINIELKYAHDGQHIYLNTKDVSERIREADVSLGASDVAVIPKVRLKLVEMQRGLAAKDNVIMDGRDIGTYVLPDAEIKIFLTASVDARAKRRYNEMVEKGRECDFESVKNDIIYRDKNDSEREFAPLKQAEDAILADTTEKNLEEAVEFVENIIKEKINALEA